MNIIVVPDGAMIVVPLIEKNGHVYLSPTDFSRYDNTDICNGNLHFKSLINKYSSSELPSGVKSRLFLFLKVFKKADVAIIIGGRPENREKIYDALNDLILFGENSCSNANNLILKIIEDSGIPTLKLPYPTNKNQIINMITQTNLFLKNPTQSRDFQLLFRDTVNNIK